jgi:hypothetical protein
MSAFTHSARKSLITARCCSLVYAISEAGIIIPLVITDNCMVISGDAQIRKDCKQVPCGCSNEISRYVIDDKRLQNFSWKTGVEETTVKVFEWMRG